MDQKNRYYQYMYSYPHKSAYYPLEEAWVREALANWREPEFSLYLHVPFCSSKCGYCNLFSVAGVGKEKRTAYIHAVCRQASQYGELLDRGAARINQVILGGGTPFSLDISQFEMMFNHIEGTMGISLMETGFDIETSPKETTKEKLFYLKQRGMRRVSIGIQSLHQQELDAISRHHSVLNCMTALDLIKKQEPSCLNMDFIYGIPGQTESTLIFSLEEAMKFQPDEIFLYPLYVRKDTFLYGRVEADEELQYRLYQAGMLFLKERGYQQVSMRRFVKELPQGESDCGFEQMLSLGCGGRSYVGELHFCEPYEVRASECRGVLERYVKKENFFDGLKGYYLNEDEKMRRFVIKNLGYHRGVSEEAFQRQFGKELFSQYRSLWELLEEKGHLAENKGRISLTDAGMGESDRILAEWISPSVLKRMKLC